MTSLVITYKEESITEDNYCVIEQMPFDTDVSSEDDVSDLLDYAYDTDPCDFSYTDVIETDTTDTTTSTEDEDEGVGEDDLTPVATEEEFLEQVSATIPSSMCLYKESYTAYMKVYLSDFDLPYKINVEGDNTFNNNPPKVSDTVTYDIELDKEDSFSLQYPSTTEILISGVDIGEATLSGNTVTLPSKVLGTIQVTHGVSYYLVDVKVACDSFSNYMPEPMFLVFYDKLVYAEEITAPELDYRDGGICIDNVYYTIAGWRVVSNDEGNVCYRTTYQYNRCRCSNARVNEEYIEVQVDCENPVYEKELFKGYVDCGEVDSNLNSPSYYEDKCCVPPEQALPYCQESYSLYHSVSGPNDKDYYNSLYNNDVIFQMILPEQGFCGNLIKQYRVTQQSCCDGVSELTYNTSDSVSTLLPGDSGFIFWEGGAPPYKLSLSGTGYKFSNGTNIIYTNNNVEEVFLSDDACGTSKVTINDQCDQEVTSFIFSTEGEWQLVGKVGNASSFPEWVDMIIPCTYSNLSSERIVYDEIKGDRAVVWGDRDVPDPSIPTVANFSTWGAYPGGGCLNTIEESIILPHPVDPSFSVLVGFAGPQKNQDNSMYLARGLVNTDVKIMEYRCKDYLLSQ